MLYLVANGPMPTTTAFAAVTTGTSLKTMLQLKTFNVVKVVEWGISFDGSAAATPIKCELIDTGTVFGTVTATVDADVFKFGGADQAVASVAGLTHGTSATGYTCTNEGSVTATKVFDVQYVAPTNQYVKQFPLGREPLVIVGNCLRIRVTAGAAVNAYCYMIIEMQMAYLGRAQPFKPHYGIPPFYGAAHVNYSLSVNAGSFLVTGTDADLETSGSGEGYFGRPALRQALPFRGYRTPPVNYLYRVRPGSFWVFPGAVEFTFGVDPFFLQTVEEDDATALLEMLA